jgi:DoxX-like family
MFTAYLVITITTIVANTFAAGADFLRAQFVLDNSVKVGVDEARLPLLGALKAAGAVGLLIGLLGVRPLGIAAAIGLVLFFIGALVTHVRARVLYNIAVPGFFFALASASLILGATG